MDRFLVPLSPSTSTSRPSSAMSEDELDQGPLFGSQELRQPFADNVGILDYIGTFFGACEEKEKLKCRERSCNTVLSYSSCGKSNFNLKNHYQRKHPKKYPDLLAALKSGSKRGRRPSVAR